MYKLEDDKQRALNVVDYWLDLLGYGWAKGSAHKKIDEVDPITLALGIRRTRELLDKSGREY